MTPGKKRSAPPAVGRSFPQDQPQDNQADFAQATDRASFISKDVQVRCLRQLRDWVAQAAALDDKPALFLSVREVLGRLSGVDGEDELGATAIVQELPRLLGQDEERHKDRRLEPAARRAAALLDHAVKLWSNAEQRERSVEQVLASNPAWMPLGAVAIPNET